MGILRELAIGAGVSSQGLEEGHIAVLEVIARTPMGFDDAERVAQAQGAPDARLPVGARLGLALRGAVVIAGIEHGRVTRELTPVGAAILQAASN